MEARVSNNLAPAAAHDGAVRCLFAIELSKKSWVAAVNTPLSDKISHYKLKPCDWKELLQLINRIRKRVSEELKKPVEVISCYEAGYEKPTHQRKSLGFIRSPYQPEPMTLSGSRPSWRILITT
jgi:transposase